MFYKKSVCRYWKTVRAIVIVMVVLIMMISGCSKPASQSPNSSSGQTNNEQTSNGQTGNSGDNLKGEITQWVWGDYEKNGAADFNKYYPDIKVNYVMVPSSDYVKKLQTTAASGGDMPDVANLEMTPRGMLVDLDLWERLDAPPYNFNKDDVVPWAIPLISNSKGEIVASQIDNCVGGYAYNRALAKEYFGTDDPDELEKIFTSWDIYIEKGKEVAEKSGGKVFLFSGPDDVYRAVIGLYTKEPWVKDNKLNLKSSILPTYKIIEQLAKEKALGKYQQWTPAWNASFTSNSVIFYPGPSWLLGFTLEPNVKDPQKAQYGLITPPGGGYSWGGTAYAIPKQSKNKMLAWTYIKWFTLSMEGTRSFVKAEKTPTLYKPSYDSDIYTSDSNNDPFFGGQNILKKLIDISENPNTAVRPMTKYDQLIEDTNGPILLELGKGMSAEEAFKKLEDEIIKKAPELQPES